MSERQPWISPQIQKLFATVTLLNRTPLRLQRQASSNTCLQFLQRTKFRVLEPHSVWSSSRPSVAPTPGGFNTSGHLGHLHSPYRCPQGDGQTDTCTRALTRTHTIIKKIKKQTSEVVISLAYPDPLLSVLTYDVCT